MTSLASVNGPSVTVIFPLASRARAPVAVGSRPPMPTILPCLAASSPSLPIFSMSAAACRAPVSRVFTIVMNRMVISRALLVLFDHGPLPLFLLPQLGRELGAEILGLEDLTDLDFLPVFERNALRPFECFLLRLHLPNPKPGDELFGLRKGAVPHRALAARVRDARTLRARLEALAGEHDARLRQLVIELAHLFQLCLGRQDAGFGVLVGLYHHDETHRRLTFRLGFRSGSSAVIQATNGPRRNRHRGISLW